MMDALPVGSSLAVLALLGAVMGWLGGFLGTGGGTFAIPALVLLLGYNQKLAQGTALVMVVVNVVFALMKYYGKGSVDVRASATIALAGFLSAALSAAWALKSLSNSQLQLMYGCFLVALALFFGVVQKRAALEQPMRDLWVVMPGLVGGVALGLFGVGGAMLAVPLLVMFFGRSQVEAQGMGLALAFPGCAVSLFYYGSASEVNWTEGAVLALGGIVGVPHGVKLAHALSEKKLRLAFSSLLVVAGTTMLYRALRASP
ncbi:sulfite exporter TauE/SafE family protein [Aquabacterium sp. A7-Y]|uniref:sulfite exporter TauE/SafE family protein n=1 Tax=Aquabacterium sp. A7-Y TaxID=1349605 RepID=UPI00223D8CD7|nr:sulfite exporter TauE/SafE family protein [Aquabacterium sp. A7-Y]MCW7539448.1 sulfite exporter TauE/SafE family protein [Aquabacterium sp. A7-Y]